MKTVYLLLRCLLLFVVLQPNLTHTVFEHALSPEELHPQELPLQELTHGVHYWYQNVSATIKDTLTSKTIALRSYMKSRAFQYTLKKNTTLFLCAGCISLAIGWYCYYRQNKKKQKTTSSTKER